MGGAPVAGAVALAGAGVGAAVSCAVVAAAIRATARMARVELKRGKGVKIVPPWANLGVMGV
jgi:hypothetical protein